MEKQINPSNLAGKGLACFVWAPNNDVLIGQHLPGRIHHSSFLAGGRVKCAGMIGFKTGFVTELSNNSGHYKPNMAEFRVFVQWLKDKGTVAAECQVKVSTGGESDGFRGSIDGFMRYGFGGLGRRFVRDNAARPPASGPGRGVGTPTRRPRHYSGTTDEWHSCRSSEPGTPP